MADYLVIRCLFWGIYFGIGATILFIPIISILLFKRIKKKLTQIEQIPIRRGQFAQP